MTTTTPLARHVLETAIRYSYEQGMIRRQPAVEELFAPSTVDFPERPVDAEGFFPPRV